MVEGKPVEILCYGYDNIPSNPQPPNKESYQALCEEFQISPTFWRGRIVMTESQFSNISNGHIYNTSNYCRNTSVSRENCAIPSVDILEE